MKLLLLIPVFIGCSFAQAQTEPKVLVDIPIKKTDTVKTYSVKHQTIATISVGFIDYYRQNINLPTGFSKNNTTGFAPLYGKIEYGISNRISIGATISYDVFYNNFYQRFITNGKTYDRYNTDRVRVFSYGGACFYHFGKQLAIKNLDAFVGLGISLNNIQHSNWPQGDSMVNMPERTVSPVLRAGARYYLSTKGSVFADAGYDKQTVFSVGYSLRFFGK